MKYVKAPVEKTATAKHDVVERAEITRGSTQPVEFSKHASVNVADIVKTHALGTLVGVGAAAAANAIINKVRDLTSQPEYRRSLDKAIAMNPRLQQRKREELEAYFKLIAEASPSVARNPLLVMNYLEYLLDHQGQLNYNAYGDLVKLEGQILSNKADSTPLSNIIQKSIVESTIKGGFGTYSEIQKQQMKDEHDRIRAQYNKP